MANVETGLGWSAAANFLRNPATLLGTVAQGGSIWEDNIPVVSSTNVAAIVAGGFLAATDNNGRPLYLAVRNNKADVSGAAFVGYVVNGRPHLVAVWKRDIGSSTDLYAAYPDAPVPYNASGKPQHDTATDLYYLDAAGSSFSSGTITRGTVYSSRAEALSALLGAQQDYYKLNSGYAVCCIAKWIDLAGETAVSPILISSDPEYTVMSTDGQSPATYTSFGAKWQNKSFTCTLVPGYDSVVTSLVPIEDFTIAFPNPISAATLFEAVARISNIIVGSTPDPYGGPESQPDGGDGEDQEGDDVPFSVPPNLSAVGSGFLTLFVPTLAEIQQVAQWMWSTGFDIETVKKIFLNPIDSVLGLHIVPCATVTDGNKEIRIAGVGSGYSANYTTHQYMPVDCGSVAVPKKWGSYLDYAPYTKTQIFLPYIGFRDIDIDDIQGKTVSLMYLIDILSGACNAELRVPTDDGNNAVLYSWAGQCAAQIPITSGDLRGAISGAVSVAASVGAAVISGGATAAIEAGANVAYNMLSQKAHVQRSGSISGAGGFIAGQQAYIVRSQPNIALPAEQNNFSGYPSFVTVTLGSIAGYNEVDSIHLENIPATDSELDEIETLLKGGVIL